MATFSSRVQSDLTPNRLTRTLARAREEGRPILDLTESNPTCAGFDYPVDLLRGLGHSRGLLYSPQALGLREARAAIAADYLRHGIAMEPGRIVLTASTSEAYSLLFKVLGAPGDEVLIPRPSYPLFEHLTRLDAIVPIGYDLDYHGVWSIDFASIERALSPRTRAILIVSPNNPTGSFVKGSELERLSALCDESGVAIIADEVFADYALDANITAPAGQPLLQRHGLVFSLGGLSKSVGLPQVKLGWIAVAGDARSIESALARLELACDTYLSVSTPVQAAAAELLQAGSVIREQIQTRITSNYQGLQLAVADFPACRALPAEGGWYAVVQLPSLRSEEDLVVELLVEDRVLVHPGYFFDFPRESYVIVSLLPPGPQFSEGIGRMLRRSVSSRESVAPETR